MLARTALAALVALLPLSGCVDEGPDEGSGSRVRMAPPGIVEANQDAPDTAGLSELLARVVKDGRVDYQAVEGEREVLDTLLAGAARTDVARLDGNARLAFYINTYNAVTLLLVVKYVRGMGPAGEDLASVLAVLDELDTDFFNVQETVVGGELLSLNDLEERARDLGDPRVLFALSCAAVSSPPLRDRAWDAKTLDADLDAAVAAYLEGPAGIRVVDGRARLPRLFEWYASDFGGKAGVRQFVARHVPAVAEALPPDGWDYVDFDWGLNAR